MFFKPKLLHGTKIAIKQHLNTFGHPVPFYFLVHHLECEQKLSIVTGLKDKPTHLVRVELESVSVWFFLDF